jgi:hypothetical protein
MMSTWAPQATNTELRLVHGDGLDEALLGLRNVEQSARAATKKKR